MHDTIRACVILFVNVSTYPPLLGSVEANVVVVVVVLERTPSNKSTDKSIVCILYI